MKKLLLFLVTFLFLHYNTFAFTTDYITVSKGCTINNLVVTSGSITGITDLAIADGGTGASTSANARINLGLGDIAVQASNNVSISGGTITGTTINGYTIADMSRQSSNNVSISGGTINGTVIGDIITANASFGMVTANYITVIDKVYAEIASSYNATATIIAASSTYYNITANAIEVITKNASTTVANGTITVNKTGKYWVAARLSGLSGNTNDVVHFGISVNDAKPMGHYESEFTLLAASGKGGQSAGGLMTLNAGDTVSCKIENTTGANNITIKFFNLSLFRILD